ncbi:hypothetical protein COT63_00705 [Candidatus Shapirobacteria bacterium CG09_land_8_20_14_0_10_38_17]|uniref:Glycosyltransferase RgtA/B/C/D-like domain-containing protein n=1 Tax=Candidatus Shapirobacteria bacterium CG09_land_8_20_14_0_10_38_17 TaxID=1974884 RepID=A0A2H0WTL7_9BACT|nr:MAG: hypothetical protein COT63_00705 [Candidatus Shapirobacteria bacterium CG09_land_8_20_14_0_10_38_17]
MKWIKNNYFLFIILIAFLFVSYFHLGRDWLYDWDEGIYGEIGREIKFPSLILSWNQETWFEKPFLVPLLVSFSFSLFGLNEFAARFFMPLFGFLTLIYVFKIANLIFNKKTALFSLTFFFFAPLFLSRSRMLNTDIALLFFTTASLYFFLILERKIDKTKVVNWYDWLKIAFFISAGVLSKGIMGFLPLLIWGTYLTFCRRDLLSKENICHWLTIEGLVILFVAPWHIYMTIKFGGDFWQVYFLEQVLRRAYQPIEYHFGGKLHYLKFLWEEFDWWSILLLIGGILLFLESLRERKIRKSFLFLSVWGILTLAVFTFSKTKLFWYILPLYPVLAILWGLFWEKVTKRRFFFALTFLIVLAAGFGKGLKSAGLAKSRQGAPKNELAIEASQKCPPPLPFLVDENERRAYDILPSNLRLSSSFSYGGAPSIVFYYQNKVDFFYNVDEFFNSFSSFENGSCAMISTVDYRQLNLKDKIIKKEGQWLLIKK